MPATTSITTVQAAAEKNSRNASELARIGQCEQVNRGLVRLDYATPASCESVRRTPRWCWNRDQSPVVKMLDQLRGATPRGRYDA